MTFLGVYLLEAHAQGTHGSSFFTSSDEWPINNKLKIDQHKSIEDRAQAARKFCQEMSFALPLYVDTMDNEFHNLFGAWPERYYIVHQAKIAQLV